MTNGTRNTFDAQRRWSAFVASNAQAWVQGSLLVTLLATTAAVPLVPTDQPNPRPRQNAPVGFVQGTPVALSSVSVATAPFVPVDQPNPIRRTHVQVGFVQSTPPEFFPVAGTPFVPLEFANPMQPRRTHVGFVQGTPLALEAPPPPLTVTSASGAVTGAWLGGVWA